MNVKKLTILTILCGIQLTIHAQSTPNFLNDFNAKRIKTTNNGFYSLLAWSGGNILYSGLSLAKSHPENAVFHRTNILWSTVNVGISLPALLALKKEAARSLSYSESFDKQLYTEKLYLVNTAIDLVYVAGALYFKESRFSARTTKPNAYYNKVAAAILIQGAFLFVYDTILYAIHTRHRKKEFVMKTF